MSVKRRIAVIGSNSFSGSDFIDLLLEDEGNDVIGISRSPEKSVLFLPYKCRESPSFRFYQMDLNIHMAPIIELFDSFEPEYVVNFAAQSEVAPSWEHPEQWFQTNAGAVTELAHALKDRHYLKRYVHISSPEVYGTCTGTVREDAPLNPSTPYAASKAAGDLSLFTFVKNFHFPMVMIRSTNVYGAHQKLYKIVPRTIIYLKQGKKIPLHGDSRAVKSYIHIRDISRGELAAMECGTEGQIYHLSPERGVAIRNLVEMICRMMGRDFDDSVSNIEERLGQDAAYIIDSTRAREELGWRSQIPLEDGLRGAVQWIEENWEEVQTKPLEYVHQT